uniref:ADP-ribosylglycohydrolase family protein n=1 Tax=Wohlfahrtiimonas populi TaxID=1940240 RepID=UPI00117D6AAE
TYNQPIGTWSDDTSLTLCLMETLVEEGTPDDLMKKFVLYQTEGYLTPYGKMFDIGIATQQSISRFLAGTPASQCGGKTEMDNGNGSLMRISPIIANLLSEINVDKRCQEVKKWSEITHAHPRSLLGCNIYMDILFSLSDNCTPKQSLEYLHDNLSKMEIPYDSEAKYYKRILDLSIIDAPRNTIQSSGYIVDTLEAAIWCLCNTDNYKDAVLTAVNLGGDTDIIGFVTGTLAGMYYKMDGIPAEWIDQLANKEMLLTHIDNFIQYYVNKDLLEKFGTLDPLDFETSKNHQIMLEERRNKTYK